MSNNFYRDYPPKMNDSRSFTDYRSHTFLNNLLKMASGTTDAYSYRQFLINNANNIADSHRNYTKMINNFR